MKRISTLTLIVVVFALASCKSNSGLTGSDAAAKAAGKACGKTLTELYSQYKSTSTIDLKSISTTKSIAELGTYCALLKENKSNANYKTAFASGLISGSSGLITKKNSSTAVNSLVSISGINESATKESTIVSVLKSLFQTFTK